ncbi:MAG: MmgE/PrpD family protein [Acidobacteria bacterium]|nr:MmgE/PrpD family protein [Acidobacteriota bacterium]
MTSAPTPLEQLAAFVAGVTYERLPADVVLSVKHRVLDTVGLCLAATPLDTSVQAVRLARAWGGPPQAAVIGHDDRLAASGAAFANGVLAHSLDFDDTHLPSVLHPSASIVPAVIAAAEETAAPPSAAIAAAAAAYEVCIRTGMAAYDRALGNSVFFERGWHATSICGTLAAAAAAAKLYGLSAAGIGHAIAIAASTSAGIIEANRAGGSVKRLHCGWAAHAGLIAAQAARAGFTGPASVFEGRFGFYQAFCGGIAAPEELTRGLGASWCVPDVFYKPYPANHFTHAGIDAALCVRRQIASSDEVVDAELAVATPTLRTIAEPRESKIRPQSGYHAQFSGPFTVAAALLGGGGLGLWLDDFTDAHVRDPRYQALAARVRCIASAECDAIFPNQFPAVLTVTLADGRRIVEKVLANRGGPGNPLSEAELTAKFRANAGRALDEAAAVRLANAIVTLEARPLEDTLSLARPSPAARV